MAYVAMVYALPEDQGPKRKGDSQVRYLAGFYDLTTLQRRLLDEALQVGWATAEQRIALSDAGVGLEEFVGQYFPKATHILDFCHTTEHLAALAEALYSQDKKKRYDWLNEACRKLKEEGGAAVRQWLEELDVSSASASGWDALVLVARQWLEGLDVSSAPPSVQQEYRRQVQYFHNHEPKMDYPTYIRNGWQIGSGPVESACKNVVANRLKGAGMRWSERGRTPCATSGPFS